MAGLAFRLAQSSDFHEILKISEGIYEGNDYLPKRYHTWMGMENWNVMLAFSGDKLVSLVAFVIVDEGRTYVTRAARTLPEFQGQGIYKALSNAVTEFIRIRFPNISRHRLVTYGEHSAYRSFKSLGFQMNLACFVKKASLRPQKAPSSSLNSTAEVTSCTQDYLCDVVFAPTVARKLFPRNLINMESTLIEPLRSNIHYLAQEYGDIYVAVEKSHTEGVPPRSVSFGVLSPRVAFTHWTVNIYTDDPALFEAHLLYQFERACKVIEGSFLFAILHDKTFTKCARRVLEQLLKMEIKEDWLKQTVQMYEVSV